MKHEIHYCTTDLYLEAPHDLAPLADALVQRGLLLYNVFQMKNGIWFARFAAGEGFEEPDGNIASILAAIEALDEPSRNMWVACTTREFDIGYDCGDVPKEYIQQISAATLTRMASAGASIMLTLYPPWDGNTSNSCVINPDENG